MISRKCRSTSDENKHKNSVVTPENTMSPGILSPRDNRINIRIPKNAKLYKILCGDNPEDTRPAWQRLDEIYSLAEENKQVFTVKLFDEFVMRISVFYPDKIEALNKLRPLIIKKILKGQTLDDSYYTMLREL